MTESKAKRWTVRRIARMVFVLTLLACLAYPLWMIFGPLPAPRISKETTWLSEPLTADGTRIDYQRAIRELAGETQGTDATPPWGPLVCPHDYPDSDTSKLPIYTTALAGLGSRDAAEEGHGKLYWQLMKRPFRRNDHPAIAALIDRNTPWYEAVLKTEPGRKRIQRRPTMDHVAHAIRRGFSIRAMLQFGEGNVAGGIESMRLMRKANLRSLQYPLREYMVSYAMNEGEIMAALRAVILSLEPVSEPLATFVLEFAREDPEWQNFVLNSFNTFERLHLLSRIDMEYNLRAVWSEPSKAWQWRLRDNWAMKRVDIDELLRFQNEIVDTYIEHARELSLPDSHSRSEDYQKELNAEYTNSGWLTWQSAIQQNQTRRWKAGIVRRSQHSLPALTWLTYSVPRERRLTQLAASLASFRAQHGRFPADLKELRRAKQARPCCKRPTSTRSASRSGSTNRERGETRFQSR